MGPRLPHDPHGTRRAVTTQTTIDAENDADRPRPEDARLVPVLTIVHHLEERRTGARCVLGPTPLELGRASSSLGAAALDHPLVSRAHVRLTADAGSLLVEDLASRNGTRLNGERIDRARAVPGDVLEIGPVLLLFHFTPATFMLRPSARLVGKSAALARVLHAIHAIAPHPTAVLVLGETGTGKELVARELHERSGRRGAFVATNCGSVPVGLLQSELFGHERGAFSGALTRHCGLFEAAHEGTLLLDEIGDASPELQLALLRVLQEGEIRRLGATGTIKVDVRVVAATHQNLDRLVSEGRFREDLLARLSPWVIPIPPLRERPEDIPHLAAEILRRLGETRRLHRSAVQALVRARYPRNVRQLEAAVERIVRQATPEDTELRPSDDALALLAATRTPSLPPPPRATAPSSPVPPDLSPPPTHDKPSLERLLSKHRGNVTHAARDLGVGRNTLYRWLREAAVSLADPRGRD